MHPYSQYGYAYAPGTTAPVAAADYTWGAAQYSWQTPPAHSPPAPNPLEQEPDALQSRTLFFGRLSDDISEESLRDICQQHGDVKKVAVYPEKHMAFVEFYDLRHAEAARDTLRSSDILGKRVEVQFSAVKRPDKDGNTGTLYVRPVSTVHVSGNWTDPNSLEAYRELFSKHGELKKVSANRKRETEKFVEFYDLRDAQKALDQLNGHVFNGATLHICFAQNASRTVNKQAERSSRRTPPDSYGPYRGSSHHQHHSGGAAAAMSRNYSAAPYALAAPYAASPAYGPYAMPYQPAPAYGLFYQQANGGYTPQQWPPAAAMPTCTPAGAAPGAAAAGAPTGAMSYAGAPQAGRAPPVAAMPAVAAAYAPAPASVVAPAAAQASRW